jgi:hypothetical protein
VSDIPDGATLAGAFLLGAVLATIAVLRILKAVTNFFAGLDSERRFRRRRRQEDDDE